MDTYNYINVDYCLNESPRKKNHTSRTSFLGAVHMYLQDASLQISFAGF